LENVLKKKSGTGTRVSDKYVPTRGEIWPAKVADISLPGVGSKPVDIMKVSPEVAAIFEDFKESMLEPEGQKLAEEFGGKPYVDSNLKGKELMKLLVRMAEGNMLTTVDEALGGIGLFTVVKKVVYELGVMRILLRLIFDQRKYNHLWKTPPWCPMGGPSSLGSLEIPREEDNSMHGAGFVGGDIPDYFYCCLIPWWISQFFCFDQVTGDELREELLATGSKANIGSGKFVAMQVLVMGRTWAVWLATTVLGAVFKDLPLQSLGWDETLGDHSRLVDGFFPLCRQALPIFSEIYPWVSSLRGGAIQEVPPAVLKELAAAAAVLPIIAYKMDLE
jgi:hypothetical protein